MLVDRKYRPVVNAHIKFSSPDFKKITLSNGIETLLIKKTELPIIKFNLLISSGSKLDFELKHGVSNLTSMCLDEGAGDFDSLQIADQFEFLGAHFAIHSDNDITLLSLQTLSENFDDGIKILSEIVTSPHLNEIEFLREKRKVQTRISQLKDEPDYIANSAFQFLLFGKSNPYALPVIGTSNSLSKIDVNDIRTFYNKFFNPKNATIILTGNFKEEQILTKIESVFSVWKTGKKSSIKIPNIQNDVNKVYILHKNGSVQTEIRTGHLSSKRDDENYFHKQLLNLILGGQFSSRLNLNLREKNGFTYGIHSRFNYLQDAGYFSVSTSVGLENTANALKEIFDELEMIRSGVTQAELDFAKSSITKRFPLNFETNSQIASIFGNKIVHGLPDDYFEKFIENILSVSNEKLNKVAFETILPDTMITVLVGDQEKIIRQIGDRNFGECIKLNYDEIFPN